MDNIIITYTIKILKQKNAGKIIKIDVDLDELEYNDIGGILIDRNFIEYSINNEEWEVIDRKIKK